MSKLQEIKATIDTLSPAERTELESMLREPASLPRPDRALPDQAARRRRVFGDKVLPNMVLLARESASA